jgi:hypothetical protein
MRFSLQTREKTVAACVYFVIFVVLIIYVSTASAQTTTAPVTEYQPVNNTTPTHLPATITSVKF